MPSVRQRVSVVVISNNKILGFWARDPQSSARYFFLPGGVLEPGESPQQAAIREVLEETGYQVRLLEKVPPIFSQYDFLWNGKINQCETTYFRAELVSDKNNFRGDADYHQGVDWVDVSNVEQIFSYHQEILSAVKAMINLASHQSF